MQLTIPEEITAEIEREAKIRNLTPQEVAIAVLRTRFAVNGSVEGKQQPANESATTEPTKADESKPKNLAEALAGYIGAVSSKGRFPEGSRMSENCGEKFAEGLLEEHQRRKP